MGKKTREDAGSDTAGVVGKVSDAEWVVLQVVWERGRVTANEVVEELKGRQAWKPKTVQTLLRRLVDKGALGYEREGRGYVFWALVSRESAERVQSRSFVGRIFEGRATPFLARFIEGESFTAEEVTELVRILESKEG